MAKRVTISQWFLTKGPGSMSRGYVICVLLKFLEITTHYYQNSENLLPFTELVSSKP